jgi:hypothetical protein
MMTDCKEGHDFMLVYSGPLSFHCKRRGCRFIIPYDKAMNILNQNTALLEALKRFMAYKCICHAMKPGYVCPKCQGAEAIQQAKEK